jgi:hypothetical protein
MPWPVSLTLMSVLAGRDFGIHAAIIPIERLIGGFHRQLAAIRHRVSGVDRDVDETCFELRNVDLDGPEPRRADDLEFDRLPERALQKIAHAG